MLVKNFNFALQVFLDKVPSKVYAKILYRAFQAHICNFLHTNAYFVSVNILSSVSNQKLFRKMLQGIKCNLWYKFLSIGHLKDRKLDA